MSIPAIPIERIYPDPNNIRGDLGDLTELAASITEVGLLQPIVVRPLRERFVIVDGHRRYEAAIIAGLTALPCLASRAKDRGGVLEVMLAAAMHKALTPTEQGRAFERLRDTGLSVTEIAARTGYSRSTVSDRLALIELPEEVLAQVDDRTITAADAVAIAKELRAGRSGSAPHRQTRSAWFRDTHPLAQFVRDRCTHMQTRRPIGGAGCGQCWEAAIRADERLRSTR